MSVAAAPEYGALFRAPELLPFVKLLAGGSTSYGGTAFKEDTPDNMKTTKSISVFRNVIFLHAWCLFLVVLLAEHALCQEKVPVSIPTTMGIKYCHLGMKWTEFFDTVIGASNLVLPQKDEITRENPVETVLIEFPGQNTFNVGAFLFNDNGFLQTISLEGIREDKVKHIEEARKLVQEEVNSQYLPDFWTIVDDDLGSPIPALVWNKTGYKSVVSFSINDGAQIIYLKLTLEKELSSIVDISDDNSDVKNAVVEQGKKVVLGIVNNKLKELPLVPNPHRK